MSDLIGEFQALPPEYQTVLQLAQHRHQVRVTPLQTLVGGWSGAMVFLVSVSWNDSKRVEHCILKLGRKSKTAKADEVTRHNAVVEKSMMQTPLSSDVFAAAQETGRSLNLDQAIAFASEPI